MATTSKQKWERYFANGDVDTRIKARAGKPIYFRNEVGEIIGTLADGEQIRVCHVDVYNPQYRIVRADGSRGRCSEHFIAKPCSTDRIGPTENLRIQSETLTKHGAPSSIYLGAKSIATLEFASVSQLDTSVLSGLQSNPRVSQEIVNQYQDYISGSNSYHIEWKSDVSMSERFELGKYLGEILAPRLVLSGTKAAFNESFFSESTRRIGFPTEASCSGIDSYISERDTTTFISSKSGEGARASVFSNILPSALRNRQSVMGTELAILLDGVEEAGITPEILESKRGSKEALYSYGMNKLLGMRVSSPIGIFQNIRAHLFDGIDLTQETCDILNLVAERCEPAVKERLPGSITQFFTRTAAARLNADEESIGDMKMILSMKDLVQLNLNVPKWHRGIIEFKVKRPENSKLRIEGNKAAIGDIDSRQGMLSYAIV